MIKALSAIKVNREKLMNLTLGVAINFVVFFLFVQVYAMVMFPQTFVIAEFAILKVFLASMKDVSILKILNMLWKNFIYHQVDGHLSTVLLAMLSTATTIFTLNKINKY